MLFLTAASRQTSVHLTESSHFEISQILGYWFWIHANSRDLKKWCVLPAKLRGQVINGILVEVWLTYFSGTQTHHPVDISPGWLMNNLLRWMYNLLRSSNCFPWAVQWGLLWWERLNGSLQSGLCQGWTKCHIPGRITVISATIKDLKDAQVMIHAISPFNSPFWPVQKTDGKEWQAVPDAWAINIPPDTHCTRSKCFWWARSAVYLYNCTSRIY